jgi:hypothetical protein
MTVRTAHAELDRAQIDSIVESARARLRDEYHGAASPRFPFGIHHASARTRVREPITRRHLKQAEISALLTEWAIEHGGAKAYAWQSVALATEELAAERGSAAAAEQLERAERELRRLPPFLDWIKSRLSAAKQPHL